MYDALTIARYVIDACNAEHAAITNLKLQKILYFIQAEFLVDTRAPCFPEEIAAWNRGPVVPSVYKKYKLYCGSVIPSLTDPKTTDYGISEPDRVMIDGILEWCSAYPESYLTKIVMDQKPWKDAYQNSGNIIPKAAIREYFSEP